MGNVDNPYKVRPLNPQEDYEWILNEYYQKGYELICVDDHILYLKKKNVKT